MTSQGCDAERFLSEGEDRVCESNTGGRDEVDVSKWAQRAVDQASIYLVLLPVFLDFLGHFPHPFNPHGITFWRKLRGGCIDGIWRVIERLFRAGKRGKRVWRVSLGLESRDDSISRVISTISCLLDLLAPPTASPLNLKILSVFRFTYL